MFAPPALVLLMLYKFLAEQITGQFRLLYSAGALFNGGFLTSQPSQQVCSHSSLVSHCKGPHHGCLSQPSAQASAVAAVNPLAVLEMCVVHTRVLFLNLSASGRGDLRIYD